MSKKKRKKRVCELSRVLHSVAWVQGRIQENVAFKPCVGELRLAIKRIQRAMCEGCPEKQKDC